MDTCAYCGYELESHENVTRNDGRKYCSVCVGRLSINLTVLDEDFHSLLVAE